MEPAIQEPDPPGGRTERLEQELRDFSYIVSHDLAASFRHLSQFSQLLLDGLGGAITPTQKTFADQIGRAAQKGQAMLEQLLVYSRVQQKILTPARYDATRLVETARLQLSGPIREAHAHVSIESLGSVHGDGDLLGMAFKHLLDNAVKFRRPEVPCRVEVRSVSRGRLWGMQVIDNGAGIPRGQEERIFQMFAQAHPDTFAGVGAGLAIARRIARRHGGDLFARPRGEGACIEMTLDMTAAPQNPL